MNQELDNLKRLGNLSNLILDRELARLAIINADSNQLRVQLSKLEEDLGNLVARRNAQSESGTVFAKSGDAKWQAWRRQKKIDLNINLARIESEREAMKVKARAAFGRARVLEGIIQKMKS